MYSRGISYNILSDIFRRKEKHYMPLVSLHDKKRLWYMVKEYTNLIRE